MPFENNEISFAKLCDKDFYIGYFSMNKTKEKPEKVFQCTKSMRRWDRLFYVCEGVTHFESKGVMLTAKKGDVVYLPNDIVYRSEWEDEYSIGYMTAEFILYDTTHRGKIPRRFSLSDNIRLAATDKSGAYFDIFEKLYDVWSKGEIGYKLKSRSILLEIISRIAVDNMKEDLKQKHRSIYKAILHLENNYTDEVEASELAKMCGMCESYFRRRFLEYAGMPPVKYKNLLRAKKAAELLATGDYNVSEAANAVGFSDIAYFNKVFKGVFGKNPKEFKFGKEE